jgi:hypothetical protein
MNTLILGFATEATTAAASALPEALQISGVALVAIFCVMGLFGAMIMLLTWLFPDESEGS